MDEPGDLVFPSGRTVAQVRDEAWEMANDESESISYKEALDVAAKRHGVFGRWESAVALLESKERLLSGKPEQKKHLEITVEDVIGYWFRRQPVGFDQKSDHWPCLEMPLPRSLIVREGLEDGSKSEEMLEFEIRYRLNMHASGDSENRLDLVKVWREDQNEKSRYFLRLPAVVRKSRQQKAG